MKKKFLKVLALIFIVPVFLTGCVTLVRSSYKEFKPTETDLSVWGFYGHIDNGRQNILSEMESLRGTTKNGYNEMYNNFDNAKPFYNLLRVGISAVDMQNQDPSTLKEAFYDFEDMKDYTIAKDTVQNQYVIRYKQPIAYNKLPNADLKVDSVIESLLFSYEIKVGVSAAGTSRNQYNLNVRQHTITPPTEFEISQAKARFEAQSVAPNSNGIATNYLLTSSSTSNTVEIVAAKIVLENDREASRYEKSVKFTRGSNISVKVVYNDGYALNEIEKKLPATSPLNGFINITYNKLEGELLWSMTNTFNGEVRYSGEAYFQGNKKFVVKELFDVIGKNAMSFGNSIVNEIKLDDTDFAFKAIKTNKFSSIKKQNVLKVGVYDNEPSAFLFSKDRTLKVAEFRKIG